jgi:hypothetical protein
VQALYVVSTNQEFSRVSGFDIACQQVFIRETASLQRLAVLIW